MPKVIKEFPGKAVEEYRRTHGETLPGQEKLWLDNLIAAIKASAWPRITVVELDDLHALALKGLSARPEESAIPEGCTPADAMVLREANHHFADENQALRRCLRWYANGEHIVGFPTWEGPSGDDNWLCPPMADFGDYRQKFIDTLDEHMVEDGAVARGTLRSGKFEVESPEDEPKVIEGEPEWHVEQQAHSSPQKE